MADTTRGAHTVGGVPPASAALLRATGAQATAGAGTMVAAVTGCKIQVIGLEITGGNATGGLVTLKSGAAGTIIARFYVSTTSPVIVRAPKGAILYETAADALLEINSAAGADVQWNVRYIMLKAVY